jgi:hypothetical protein
MNFLEDVIIPIQKEAYAAEPAALSEAEYTVLCIDALEGEVNNGGFHQFFFNMAGDLWPGAIAALVRIGAPKTAALVKQATEMFPITPSTDRVARQAQLEGIDPERFEALDNAFYEYQEPREQLLIRYWLANK